MRKKLGLACMIIGVVLLIGALALLIFNYTESKRAEQSCAEAVSQLKDSVAESDSETDSSNNESDTTINTSQMAEIELDGYSYIGYLFIPSMELELPVMSQWDYDRLSIAPCRYSGSIAQKNLVLIAHNYRSHFGNINQLQSKDKVNFTDVTGVVTTYEVVSVDVVPPTSAKEVVAGDCDLALVTCTYGGKTRFVVYCEEVL